ncbi:hypothetical protein [Candidatus Kuenenia stuttgartiensis]|uniref:Strongly similar to chaperone Hsp90, heat shock protein C 62.5 n=1 Tax=Kuenenia stuttgartiensis TaxID=174633 RepID=A0A2C9CEC2_KUEST|nr:hypothetical protein [Candidatus Kuenenia stuttgartiensis]SOH04046.1 strongly similar to chaperone Hsp90, heat shock protein C 62.5 [Candidatus Kuenenia stuttgartiensis]
MNEIPDNQQIVGKIITQLYENALMQDGVVFDHSDVPRVNELLEELTNAKLGEGKKIII